MAADTVAPTGISVQLPADVYKEQFEFVELVRDVIDSIDSQTPDDIVHTQVELLLAIIGRDLLKLHALVEVVNTKIESRSSWATTAAVKFYRTLFADIDQTLELEVFNDASIVGADIVGMYILDAAGEFITRPIWDPGCVNVLEFSVSLLRSCSIGERGSTIAENLECSLLEKMAKSLYLPFNDNYDTLVAFAYKAVPLLDTADGSMESSRVTDILKALKKEDYQRTTQEKAQLEQMYNILGRSDLYPQHTEPVVDKSAYGRGQVGPIPPERLEEEVATSWELFAATLNWECPAIERFLKSIHGAMKIDAPLSTQTITLRTIEAMAHSEHLFLRKNLQILVCFIFSVAPALDAMSDTHQCERLTALLDELSIHRSAQTPKHRDTIDGLRRNLGRMLDLAPAQPMHDKSEEDELLLAVSKLDID